MSDQSFTPPPLKLRPYGGIEMCVPLFLSLLLLLFLGPTSTKPQAEILKLNDVNGCNDISFGDDSILEGDRIPPLKSHGQALEEELCFPGVLSDTTVMRRPISCVTSMAVSCHAPAVSMANGQKMFLIITLRE